MEEMDCETNFRNGGINITGFQMLNYTRLLKQNYQEREWTKWEWPGARDALKIPVSKIQGVAEEHSKPFPT